MLLGHWLQMKAIAQAQGALNALAALLPEHGGQRTRPLVPRSGQSPLGGAFQCLLQIAWASDVDRWVSAQPTRTALYGPVRTVVWQGSAGDRRPYADGPATRKQLRAWSHLFSSPGQSTTSSKLCT